MGSPQKRRTIYLAAQAAELLERFNTDAWNASGIVSSVLIRYYSAIERECPPLSKNEWLAICDVANSMSKQTDSYQMDPAKFFWASVEDASKMDGLSEKWEINGESLSIKLKQMSYIQQCSVLEVAALFWSVVDNDFDAALAFAKANIAD